MEQVAIHKHYDIVSFSFPGAADVWFSLNGKTYQNNSCVALEDRALVKEMILCSAQLTLLLIVQGNWFFPNGTRIPVNEASAEQWDFYRTSGTFKP